MGFHSFPVNVNCGSKSCSSRTISFEANYPYLSRSSTSNSTENFQNNKEGDMNNFLDEKSLLEEKFSLFPNPTKDIVKVISSTKHIINEISVYDIKGNVCFTKTSIDQYSFELDVSHLSSGIYTLIVNRRKPMKLVKN